MVGEFQGTNSVFLLPFSLLLYPQILSFLCQVPILDKLVTSVKKKSLTHPKPLIHQGIQYQNIPGTKLPLLVFSGEQEKAFFHAGCANLSREK